MTILLLILLIHLPRILVDSCHFKYHFVVNVTRGTVDIKGRKVDVLRTLTALGVGIVPGGRHIDEVSHKLLEGGLEPGYGRRGGGGG